MRTALALLALLVVGAVAAPAIADLLGVSAEEPVLALRRCPSSAAHWLGCDELGRDLLLRLLSGGRVSLAVGLLATLLATGVGVVVGLTAAGAGGRVDFALMRACDALLAVPILPLLLIVSAQSIGQATSPVARLIVLLGLFGWMGTARVARAEAMRVQALPFVDAARALGTSPVSIALRHVLPNAFPAVFVAATLDVGRNILAEAALSYLGLGVRPPTPSWGNMLTHAEDAIFSDPSQAVWPGVLIVVTVACIHVVGEALRRSLDPRHRVEHQARQKARE